MFLHSLFFPNYLPLSDFSVLEPYVFSDIPSFHICPKNDFLVEKEPIIKEKEPIVKEKEVIVKEKEVIIKEKEVIVKEKEPIIKEKKSTLFHVQNVQDELFWLVFVAIYGETEYYRNKYNYGKVEIQEKQKIAEKIQDPEFAKKMKWKWTKIQRIEMISDLTNRPNMPIAIFNVLSAYYECNFILVDSAKKVYLKYDLIPSTPSEVVEDIEKTYIIYVTSRTNTKGKEKKEYSIDLQPSRESLQKIQDEMFALEHYERPLKAISNYKKIELDGIATKIGLSAEGAVSKQEIYDRIRLSLSDSVILFLQE